MWDGAAGFEPALDDQGDRDLPSGAFERGRQERDNSDRSASARHLEDTESAERRPRGTVRSTR